MIRETKSYLSSVWEWTLLKKALMRLEFEFRSSFCSYDSFLREIRVFEPFSIWLWLLFIDSTLYIFGFELSSKSEISSFLISSTIRGLCVISTYFSIWNRLTFLEHLWHQYISFRKEVPWKHGPCPKVKYERKSEWMLYVMKEKIPLSLYIRKTIIIHSKLRFPSNTRNP